MAYPFDMGAATATPAAPTATPINWNSLKLSDAPVSPAVITSKTAQNDLQNIQTQHATITNDITQQAQKVAQTKAQADADLAAKAQAKAQTDADKAKLAIEQQNADAKTAAIAGAQPNASENGTKLYLNPDGNSYSATPLSNTSTGTSAGDAYAAAHPGLSDPMDRAALEQANIDYQNAAKTAMDTITNIQNGTIPLSAGEQAQIDALKQQFKVLIDEQALTNQGAKGIANVRGYQKGAAEYDANFTVKTIGTIVTAGQNKIADLNVKMAGAVAAMTQGFKDADINAVKDSWNLYQDAARNRQDALRQTINDTTDAIKQAQEIKQKQDEAAAKIAQAQIDATLKQKAEEAKNITDLIKTATTNNAPIEVIDEMQAVIDSGGSLADAYAVGRDYAQGGTGIIGEYNYAKANGYRGDFSAYQNADANRKRQIININSGGLTPQENQTYLTITNKYQADPIINAAIKAGQIKALTAQIKSNPEKATNQLASLYVFVKNLDPDSAVREGELSLANQTQSYQEQFSNYLARASKGQVLAPQAAVELADATDRLVDTWQQTASKKTKMYQSQAQNSSKNVGNSFGSYVNDFITYPMEDTSAASAAKVSELHQDPAHRPKVEELTSQGFTDDEIAEYFQSKGM